MMFLTCHYAVILLRRLPFKGDRRQAQPKCVAEKGACDEPGRKSWRLDEGYLWQPETDE
jgi:hypothetical protein